MESAPITKKFIIVFKDRRTRDQRTQQAHNKGSASDVVKAKSATDHQTDVVYNYAAL